MTTALSWTNKRAEERPVCKSSISAPLDEIVQGVIVGPLHIKQDATFQFLESSFARVHVKAFFSCCKTVKDIHLSWAGQHSTSFRTDHISAFTVWPKADNIHLFFFHPTTQSCSVLENKSSILQAFITWFLLDSNQVLKRWIFYNIRFTFVLKNK